MHCDLIGAFVSNTCPNLYLCLSGLHEFESQKNHEVNEFRAKMRSFCEEKAHDRHRLPWYHWMEYSFPCDLEPSSSLPEPGGVKSKSNKKILINIKFEASDVSPRPVLLRFAL